MPEVGRNRIGTDEMLEAADRIFGRDGLGASMREIAREARVADAVLYRRFPTRDDLVFRLLADDERKLRRQIEEGTALGHPEGILFGWLSEVNRFLLRYRGLAEAVLRGLATPDNPWKPFATRLVDLTRQHVELARSNGSCRPGIWPTGNAHHQRVAGLGQGVRETLLGRRSERAGERCRDRPVASPYPGRI